MTDENSKCASLAARLTQPGTEPPPQTLCCDDANPIEVAPSPAEAIIIN